MISSSIGLRYSFPVSPSATTDVITVAVLPATLSERRSSIVIIVLQQGQVTPERDIVPPASCLSYSRFCAELPFASDGASFCTPKTTPVLSAFGSIVSTTRLLSFLHNQRVLSSGTVARQFLQLTVLAQR